MVDETNISEQTKIRMDKRQTLLDDGIEPYLIHSGKLDSIETVRSEFSNLKPEDKTGQKRRVGGRIMFKREAGRLVFIMLQDGKHNKLQAMISEGNIGKDEMKSLKKNIDLADIIIVEGEVVCSKTGELSIFVDTWKLASKALRPMPVLHKELSEFEQIKRRYVDFMVSDYSRDLIEKRIKIVSSLRRNYENRGYVEMETPMLQLIHGGASAKPFKTFINAFDSDVYLRIAPELFLKRAVVGGFERVFEINRNFRNEGADSSHSPEFSMLESYEAFSDYLGVAALTEDLIRQAAIDSTGSSIVTLKDGSTFDFQKPFRRIDFYNSVSEKVGFEVTPNTPLEDLLKAAKEAGLEKEAIGGDKKKTVTKGKVAELLFEHYIGDHIVEPTFVMDYPEDTSPLVSPSREKPGVVEKWDLYIRGVEVGTGYSELIDPVIQRERFKAQSLLAANGDEEAMQLDTDFLEAMEYGLPPMGGMGMGIDRLVMSITGETSIRQTIPFPLVK